MPTIEKATFGRTGHVSTRLVFGAAAFSEVTQAEADATMDLLLLYGINHIDTAASYGGAEDRLGDWIRRHGRPFFLASKTGEREKSAAYGEIRRSLERMAVDQVDLIQLHNLVDPGEWATALGPGGALEAAIDARDEGLVRYIGVTGHGWTVAAMHQRSLERFDFDSVLLPYSYTMMQNEAYRADFEAVYDLCMERNVAVQTIKSVVHQPWGDLPQTRATWYKPLEDQESIDTAVQWVLNRPAVFLPTVGDIHVLPRMLEAGARYAGPISDEQMREQVQRLAMRPLF